MHRCDLLDEAAFRGLLETVRPAVLVHTAWDVTHSVYWTSPANFAWLAASVRLVDAFLRQGGRRVVGVGTCAEYAWTEARYNESDGPLAPQTPYGRCKLALYHMFEAARLRGASTAWARLFFPYGTGDADQRFIPQLLAALRAGRPLPMTEGTQVRDFIHADDVGAGLAAIAAGTVTGAVNLGTGVGASLRDVASWAAEVVGADPTLLRFGDLPMREGEAPSIVADIARLRDEAGFTPRVTWRDGVALTALGGAVRR